MQEKKQRDECEQLLTHGTQFFEQDYSYMYPLRPDGMVGLAKQKHERASGSSY